MGTEWPICPLGDLVDNHDALRMPVRAADRRSGPYPYYGASGVVDHVDSFIFDGEYLLVAEDGENLRTRKTPIAFLAKGRFWVNNHAHILRGNEHADTRYLMYYLATSDVSGFLTGSTMPKLTQRALHRIPVVAPPIDEQRRIAAVLGALDDKVELNRKMNRTLEEMAQAIFKSWFIDFDGVPESEMVDSELGRIPKGWMVDEIGNIVSVLGGSTPSTKDTRFWDSGIYHWTTPKDLSSATCPLLLDTERRITDAGLAKISSGLLPAGTFLLSSRAPIGYTAIASVPLAVNQGYIAIPPGGRLNSFYLLYWTRANLDQIKGRAGGTTFQEISKRSFRPIQIVVPPRERLEAFSRVLGPLFSKIEVNERNSRSLAALRDALLPKLISGELRVPPSIGGLDT